MRAYYRSALRSCWQRGAWPVYKCDKCVEQCGCYFHAVDGIAREEQPCYTIFLSFTLYMVPLLPPAGVRDNLHDQFLGATDQGGHRKR